MNDYVFTVVVGSHRHKYGSWWRDLYQVTQVVQQNELVDKPRYMIHNLWRLRSICVDVALIQNKLRYLKLWLKTRRRRWWTWYCVTTLITRTRNGWCHETHLLLSTRMLRILTFHDNCALNQLDHFLPKYPNLEVSLLGTNVNAICFVR